MQIVQDSTIQLNITKESKMTDLEKLKLLQLAFKNADAVWVNIEASVLEQFEKALDDLIVMIEKDSEKSA